MKLRELRQRRAYSQVELAELVGVERATISRAEQGKHTPRGRTLRKLAEVLGVDVEELIVEPKSA